MPEEQNVNSKYAFSTRIRFLNKCTSITQMSLATMELAGGEVVMMRCHR
uniref:Uncharacterized protein n=1 Tax=Arundo donax TaxID=35708 RepID=A0A0A9ATE7_ARUDO